MNRRLRASGVLLNQKKTYLEKDAAKSVDKSKPKLYRSTVLVKRLGEVQVPVDVLIHFSNGETVRENWDGQYRWIRYEYVKRAEVDRAEVDPSRKLALEQNFTNNSRTAKEDNRAAATWYVRWIFWLENLFFASAFFG